MFLADGSPSTNELPNTGFIHARVRCAPWPWDRFVESCCSPKYSQKETFWIAFRARKARRKPRNNPVRNCRSMPQTPVSPSDSLATKGYKLYRDARSWEIDEIQGQYIFDSVDEVSRLRCVFVWAIGWKVGRVLWSRVFFVVVGGTYWSLATTPMT